NFLSGDFKILRSLGINDACASLGNLGEDLLFVFSSTLHGFNKVGNQISAPLIRCLHIAECTVDRFLSRNRLVVNTGTPLDEDKAHQKNGTDDNQNCD